MARPTFEALGLVNTQDMLKKAFDGGYAVPAYNFNNMEQLQAIIIGCAESRSPVILQCSGSARKYMHPTFLKHMARGAVDMMQELGGNIPVALHLEAGDDMQVQRAVELARILRCRLVWLISGTGPTSGRGDAA